MKRFCEKPSSRGGRPLAILPAALLVEYDAASDDNEYGDGVVCIEGPLQQRADMHFDGYDAIQCRFNNALACAGDRVILKINSPGGDVAGLTVAVKAMRKAAKAAGKTVVAYVDEAAYSAAYALATVANWIVLPESGGVGSIGVIDQLCDRTEANKLEGYKVSVVASGALKTDGHPDVPIAEAVLERVQKRVDELADQFAELVAERRGGSAEDYLALEAGCFHGQGAVSQGLADEVLSWDELITKIDRGAMRVPSYGAESPRRTAAMARSSSEERKMKRVKKSEEIEETYDAEETEAEEAEESEGAEESEDSESAEAADEADDSEDDTEDDGPPSSKDMKKSKKSAEAIVAAACRVTGKSSANEVLGALEALGHSRVRVSQLAAKVERLERENRRTRVAKMVNTAIRAGQLTPAQKQWATNLGLSSPKSLSAYLETAPKLVRSDSVELGAEAERYLVASQSNESAAKGIWEKFGLDAAGQAKAAELLSQAKTKARVAGGRN